MACIGFDLDETLGRFAVPYYHILALQPYETLYNAIWSGRYGTRKQSPPAPLSASLKEKLDRAFELFIACLASKEPHLGILRPGIIEIARRLYELKTQPKPGVRSVVIYSNNGSLPTLRLAGKLIEKLADAPGLFCNYVHWFHPSRSDEVEYGNPGAATKTLNVLMGAFQSGDCSHHEIDVEQVYFFDDLHHPDIADAIGERYFVVPPYQFDADPQVVDECFLTSFKASGLENDPEYWAYISPLGIYSFTELYNFILRNQIQTFKKNIPNNTGLRTRFHSVFPAPPVPRGGRTRKRSKTNKRRRSKN